MLSSSDRSKLKSKVGRLKSLLIEKFTDYANTRYYLQISEEKRKKELFENHPIGYHEWEQIEKKLATTGMSVKEYIFERSYTYLNRTFFLMRLEILGIQKYPVFHGMKESNGWKEFKLFCPNLCQDADEGFLFLTRQVSDYYARELPGLFLDDSADRAFGIPRELIYELFLQWNDPELSSIFLDDTTAGWIYQYWNDPDREAINERVKDKGKILGKEIASATQLFTERYMVEWLIQNSVGNLWFAICKKNQWNTNAIQVLGELKERRKAHNQKIAKKVISEDTALLIETEEEEYWKYFLERELSEEEIQNVIGSIREIKLLDPACGSGHFLLYAFYFLFYLYKEEDRILKSIHPSYVEASDAEIAKSILENNLHGVDLDPRAIQIAVASLYTTARRFGELQLNHLNLVATRPSIGSHTSEEELNHFKDLFCESLNVPRNVADSLIELLGTSDVLGSLLQIRTEIRNQVAGLELYFQDAEGNIFSKLEEFLKDHDLGNDLGVFTLGTQLSRGLRLIRILDSKYDVVVANPPYLSNSKVEESASGIFVNGASELYESFIYAFKDRLKDSGHFALLTAHNFLFIEKFFNLRKYLLENFTLDSLVQLGVWTFKEISQPGALGFACFILRNEKSNKDSLFFRIGSGNFRKDPYVKEPFLLNQPQKRLYHFDQRKFADIEGSPMIYWWTENFRKWYLQAEKVGELGEVMNGMSTTNNERFLLKHWECKNSDISLYLQESKNDIENEKKFVPIIDGSKYSIFLESLSSVIRWRNKGLEIKSFIVSRYGNYGKRIYSEENYFNQGISFNLIGASNLVFRLRKFKSIFLNSAPSIFNHKGSEIIPSLQSKIQVFIANSINPTINNTSGDIKNLPIPNVIHSKDFVEKARVLSQEEFSIDETNIEYEYEG
ncbi:Eco57I restriction-modification methylase [Leptospira yanagawae serovar Saopaulo str. Sao Paulo = ATCC 700523]|uniref:site-specific DNA-methyltransferase (adenine-specific) n=1 Tax=Leptospira yanagawae serovar Saopaulo str. Sao Paulo = ATCC 700523 TaxID=1249483 RepID=A0A5E8HHG1_9LEPT|nr:N-6 DNA methylase [Leptospira yanagawae]EOQ90764.1 Eco57I restriction-modification methylase [Leptospira yanagawae serovar Saopaulo str. Sao Paulo = ATCC 700523]